MALFTLISRKVMKKTFQKVGGHRQRGLIISRAANFPARIAIVFSHPALDGDVLLRGDADEPLALGGGAHGWIWKR